MLDSVNSSNYFEFMQNTPHFSFVQNHSISTNEKIKTKKPTNKKYDERKLCGKSCFVEIIIKDINLVNSKNVDD